MAHEDSEDWGFEWQEPHSVDVLIVDLAEKAIKCAQDCEVLYDEIESIATDYPEYKIVVFRLPDGKP